MLPKQVFTFLGQVFDLSKGVCYPTEARFLSIQEAIHPLLFNPLTTPRQAMHLLGLLASTEKLVPQGRLHMRHLQFHLRRNYNCHLKGALDSPFTLDPSVKVHLRWWLLRNNVMAQAPLHPPKYVTSIYTDASAQGWGAHCAHMIAQGYWSTQQSKLHINVLELKAVLLAQDLCPSVIPSSKDYSGSLRQHNCLCLHKQTRGHSLLGHVCPHLAPVCLLSQEQGCSYSKTRSRGHESCSRPTLQVSTDPSYRVVSQSQDLQVAVTNRLPTSNRSLCHKIQSPASPVCFSSARSQGSGNRCPGDELVRTSSLLLPSYSSLSTCGQEVNQLSELQDASCCSSLGNQRVASGSIGIVNKKANRSSSKRKSLKATSSRGVSSKSKESKPSCLLAEVSLEKKGFSQEVTNRILSPIRKSSKSVYEAKWNGFCTWCEEHGFSAMHPTVPIIAEFFLFLFSEKKLLPQTIEGYRSALSMKLDADLELGSNKELKRLIQSFYKSRPKTSRHIPSWDLTLVLQALTKAPFEPLSLAEPKFLTWKTVFLIALASGRRRSEIHAFTFKGCSHSKGWSKVILKTDPAFLAKNQLASEGASIFSEIEIPALTKCLGQWDTEDRSLCPVRALRHYLSRTSDLRQGRSLLFVSLLKSKQGDIAAQTISNWIKDLIHFTLKNCSTENASLHGVKAHDVRAQAASWSFKGGIPLLDIMRSCTWKSHSMFTSFYFRNVALKNLEDTYRLGDIVAAQCVVSLST